MNRSSRFLRLAADILYENAEPMTVHEIKKRWPSHQGRRRLKTRSLGKMMGIDRRFVMVGRSRTCRCLIGNPVCHCGIAKWAYVGV